MKLFKYTFVLAIGIMLLSAFSMPDCYKLGWSGGSAGSGTTWVNSHITQRGDQVTITYDHKNGSMTGTLVNDHTVKGSWHQDGSAGGSFMLAIPEGSQNQAKGWWSSKGSTTKHDLWVRLCD